MLTQTWHFLRFSGILPSIVKIPSMHLELNASELLSDGWWPGIPLQPIDEPRFHHVTRAWLLAPSPLRRERGMGERQKQCEGGAERQWRTERDWARGVDVSWRERERERADKWTNLFDLFRASLSRSLSLIKCLYKLFILSLFDLTWPVVVDQDRQFGCH